MASMTEKDYYAILEVSEQATSDEIRRAFQQKARKLHPDVNDAPDAEERFKEISEAYAVLSDDDKRRRYDAMRSGSPFAGYGASGYPGGSAPAGDPFGGTPFDWGFPFGTTSRRTTTRSRAYRPKAGADITLELTLDEKAAAEGCHRGITYQHYVTCEHCHGSGSVTSAHAETCPTCSGTGHITLDLTGFIGFGVMDIQCPECEGSGKVVANPCEACGGSGRVLSASEVVIDVPKGSHDGDEVIIDGAGNAGTNGEASGSFVCRIGVPSEQVSPAQARGFHILGFAIPFIVFGLITNTLLAGSVWWVIMLVLGLWLIFKGGGVLGHNRYWWKSALDNVVSGATSGVTIALFATMMIMCSTGFGRPYYR